MEFNVNKINILEDDNNNIKNIMTNIIINIYKSNNQFIIFQDNSLIPIIQIKNPIYISKNNNEIIVKDNKKNKTYIIQIISNFTNCEYMGKYTHIKKSIYKQEKDYKQEIINNFNFIFPELDLIQTEYNTPYGLIDILAIDGNDNYHIFELKKNKTTFNSIEQVERYGEYFISLGKDIILYNIVNKYSQKEYNYSKDKNVKLLIYKNLLNKKRTN